MDCYIPLLGFGMGFIVREVSEVFLGRLRNFCGRSLLLLSLGILARTARADVSCTLSYQVFALGGIQTTCLACL